MLRPFFNQISILEILLKRLESANLDCKIIIATTTNDKDNQILDLCNKLNINCFRGDENNVLKRFIYAAEENNIQNIVRVCADNPFLLTDYIKNLLSSFTQDLDYLSFKFKDGTPTIKSHVGLFAEMTTLKSLKKVQSLTNNPLYLEHVTNYIYTNPQNFNIKLIPLPEKLINRKDIRLTVDTIEDFKLTQELYSLLQEDNLSVENLINEIDKNDRFKKTMLVEIKKNSKWKKLIL